MTDYCGQRDVCAEAPGCMWHWGERVREVMAERDAALAALREAEADVAELGATVAAAVAERDEARGQLREYRDRVAAWLRRGGPCVEPDGVTIYGPFHDACLLAADAIERGDP